MMIAGQGGINPASTRQCHCNRSCEGCRQEVPACASRAHTRGGTTFAPGPRSFGVDWAAIGPKCAGFCAAPVRRYEKRSPNRHGPLGRGRSYRRPAVPIFTPNILILLIRFVIGYADPKRGSGAHKEDEHNAKIRTGQDYVEIFAHRVGVLHCFKDCQD